MWSAVADVRELPGLAEREAQRIEIAFKAYEAQGGEGGGGEIIVCYLHADMKIIIRVAALHHFLPLLLALTATSPVD